MAYTLVIGGGVMGRAIVEGGLRAGVLRAGEVGVVEPEAPRRRGMESLGVETWSGIEAVRWSGGGDVTVLLCTKPQMFEGVAASLRAALGGRPAERSAADSAGAAPLVVSIMAGVRSATIAEQLRPVAVRVVRAMPNTPARVGQGVTGVCAGPGAMAGDVQRATRLFEALGPVVVPIDESLMDAFTAVAGSGPAYLFYLAEAMERAAMEIGFEAGVARVVVAQTLRGAAALLASAGDGATATNAPEALRAAVTSKGGTTAAAVRALEEAGVGEAWVRAIRAARDRGRELAGGAG